MILSQAWRHCMLLSAHKGGLKMPHQCPSGPCILTNVKPGNLFQEPTRIASDGAARQLCASRRHLDCRFAATCVCHPVHPPQMHIFIILEPMWKSCAHCATVDAYTAKHGGGDIGGVIERAPTASPRALTAPLAPRPRQ